MLPVLAHMRFGIGLSFIALALSLVVGYATEPVNFHAANAAEAADVAQQAAKVANRVAAHTEEVAHDTAAALRYTQDALKRAGANGADVRAVGREADNLEEEAGLTGEAGQSAWGSQNSRQSSEGYSRRDGSANGDGYEGSSRDGSSRGSSGSGVSRSSSNRGESQDASGRSVSQEIRSGEAGSASGRANGYSDGRGGGGHGNGGDRGSEGYQGHESGSDGGNIERSLDVNTEIVPYPNGVEPFGQEEPARQMTKESVKQSDGMVKQIETAQGVEAKRSVYRALTKLRGATIASYDGMAKAHLKNVDNYNKKHKWREDHPMRHLAEEESDTHAWAFPKKNGAAKKKAKKAPAAKKVPAGLAAPAPAQAA